MALDLAKLRGLAAARSAPSTVAPPAPTTNPAPQTTSNPGVVAAVAPRVSPLAALMQKSQPVPITELTPDSTSPLSKVAVAPTFIGRVTQPEPATTEGSIDEEEAQVEHQATLADTSTEQTEAAQNNPVVVPASGLARLNIQAGVAPASVPDMAKLDVIEPGPEGFKERLARLDRLIAADHGISELSIDVGRKFVQDIAIELRDHPEYDGIMQDLDVHNIMVFMRATMARANAGFAKKAAASEKKSAKASSRSFDFSGAAALMAPQSGPANSLEALANFDASKLPTLNRRG